MIRILGRGIELIKGAYNIFTIRQNKPAFPVTRPILVLAPTLNLCLSKWVKQNNELIKLIIVQNKHVTTINNAQNSVHT